MAAEVLKTRRSVFVTFCFTCKPFCYRGICPFNSFLRVVTVSLQYSKVLDWLGAWCYQFCQGSSLLYN